MENSQTQTVQASWLIVVAFILVGLIATIVFSSYLSDRQVDSKPWPSIKNASYNCNTTLFLNEYNYSNDDTKSIIYNNIEYRIINNHTGFYLPITDSSCSLSMNATLIEDILTYTFLQDALYDKNLYLYRDLAKCYGVSWGSRLLCEATTETEATVSHPLVELAANNERKTLSIVNRLTPEGWEKETVPAAKNLFRLRKVIKGPGYISLTFEVVDTSACFLKDSVAVSIFDYSLNVGDDLWYFIKKGNSYYGMDKDIFVVNSDLLKIMSSPDTASIISNLASTALGKDCSSNAINVFGPSLESINSEIKISRNRGHIESNKYIGWIDSVKKHADGIKSNTLNNTNVKEIFSNYSDIKAKILLTKFSDYQEARKHYANAEEYYSRGLFHSAENEYLALLEFAERWTNPNILDYIFSFLAWFVIFYAIIAVFKRVFKK